MTATITILAEKGSPLSHTEMDNNFRALRNLVEVPTVAALRAMGDGAIPAGNGTVITQGFRAVGDGGGGRWYWDATASASVYDNGGTVVRPTGHAGSGVWRRDYDGPINVLWFGAYRDNTNATTTRNAIQAAIDWALYRDTVYTESVTATEAVYMPGGIYRIDDVIHLGYGDKFTSCHLFGDGVRTVCEIGFPGTGIVTTFSDRPAISVAGGRHVTIKGLTLLGTNYSWVNDQALGSTTPTTYSSKSFSRTGTTVTVTHTNHPFGSAGATRSVYASGATSTFKSYQYTITVVDANTYTFTTTESGDATGSVSIRVNDLVAAAWVGPTLNANANSRYAPYAGVAIDAYRASSAPSPAYPTKVFPSWLGYSTQYSTGIKASSMVILEDVAINGFVVGVVVAPGGADGNGDFTKLHRVQISHCVYGFSISQSQARLQSLINCLMAQVFTCLVNTVHGAQNAGPQFSAECCEFSFCNTLCDFGNMNGNPVFKGCYSETLYRIGRFYSGASTYNQATFIGCSFSFDGHDYRGVPLNIADANVPVRFQDCRFSHYRSDTYILPFTGITFRFNACRIVMYDDGNGVSVSSSARQHAINATYKIGTTGRIATFDSGDNVGTGLYNLVTGILGPAAGGMPGGIPITGTARGRYLGQPMHYSTLPVPYNTIRATNYQYDKSGATITQSGRTVTIAFAADYSDYIYIQYGGDVGDYCYDNVTNTTFIVTARTGDTLTLEAQNNFNHAGNLYSTITASGYLIAFNCRLFGLSRYATYSSTSGNANITVSSPDSVINWIGDTNHGVVAGDYLLTLEERLNLTSVSGGLVNSVNTSTGVIALNSTMNATKTGAEFCLFVKKLANE